MDLIKNIDKREEMGQRAFKIAMEKFDWKFKIVEIENIMKEMIRDI
jgi:hypothetical protein